MEALLPYFLGFIGAAISGFVAWSIAKRQSSGRVDTTAAAVLWEERRAMTTELKQEVIFLRGEAERFHREVTLLKDTIYNLRLEIAKLVQQGVLNTQEVARLTTLLEGKQ